MTDSTHTQNPATEPQHKSKRRRNIFGNVAILLIAPVVAILLTMFVFQSYQVDGLSMQNTLQHKDRLIVWKGSKTWAHLFGEAYIPNRGDIIIVNQSDLSACGQEGRQIIKRVIGLPGDHVVYKNGVYTVYNTANPSGFNPDTTLPYGKADTALLDNPNGSDADFTLGKNQLFVSGDHRANSCDSRAFGPIEADQIVGKLIVRIYPISDAKLF